MGLHRADIRNPEGTVIELQHSSISTDDVALREEFYGEMVWIFDATERFLVVPSGDRAFFSLARTEHIKFCSRPVFLDCGDYIIEVERFTNDFDKLSGFGIRRDRHWFEEKFLASCLKRPISPSVALASIDFADWWQGKQPWRLTEFPSIWRDQASGNDFLIPEKSLYLPLEYKWKSHPEPVWGDVISIHPEIANGWTIPDFKRMLGFLCGTPMILHGRLRVMPRRAEHITVTNPLTAIKFGIEQARLHMKFGRVPILRSETEQMLLEKAKQYEIATYGRPLGQSLDKNTKFNGQRNLFG